MGKIGVIAVIAVALAISMQGVEGLECSQCIYTEDGGKVSGTEECKTTGTKPTTCPKASAPVGLPPAAGNSSMTEQPKGEGPPVNGTKTNTTGEMYTSCVKIFIHGANSDGSLARVYRGCIDFQDVRFENFCYPEMTVGDLLSKYPGHELHGIWFAGLQEYVRRVDKFFQPNYGLLGKSCNCVSDKCNMDEANGGTTLIYSLPVIFTCLVMMVFLKI